MNTEELMKKAMGDVDIEGVSRNIQWMVDHVPYRIAGSEDERIASEYVTDYMKKYGLETKNEEFYTFNSFPLESEIEILEPVNMKIDSLPCAHIRSTSKEGDEFEIVYIGNGSEEEYKDKDVKGKIVLVEVSYAPPVPEKGRIAWKKGAAGMMCMNWGNDEEVICNRGLKAVWGNPTEETVKNIPQIVGVGITRNAGLMIKKMCLEGKTVKAKIKAIAKNEWGKLTQPFGILHGNGKSKEFILVASHLDAWKPGVTCNATGDSTTMEMIRILSKYREYLDRDIWFTYWDGHEIAEAAGSTWFVDEYWEELSKNCIAYVNVDSTGMREATLYEIKASDELYDFMENHARGILDCDLRMTGLGKIGDQSFMGIGIPATAQRMSFTKEYMEHAHGATLGWWNHTKEDGFDKYSPENIKKDIDSTMTMLIRLSNEEKIPYEFQRKFDTIQNKLTQIKDTGEIGVDHLIQLAKTAEDAVVKIQGRKDEITDERKISFYNEFVKMVSRKITNVFQTYVNKYQQDSYGFTSLSKPVPLLADMERLETLSPDTMEYGMVRTQLIKNRNRILDGLMDVISMAELYEKIIFE